MFLEIFYESFNELTVTIMGSYTPIVDDIIIITLLFYFNECKSRWAFVTTWCANMLCP